MSEPLRPYVATMLDLATALLETENEPNTIACIKLIIDLYKNCRPPLKEQVQRFLLFVQRIFSEFPTTAVSGYLAVVCKRLMMVAWMLFHRPSARHPT